MLCFPRKRRCFHHVKQTVGFGGKPKSASTWNTQRLAISRVLVDRHPVLFGEFHICWSVWNVLVSRPCRSARDDSTLSHPGARFTWKLVAQAKAPSQATALATASENLRYYNIYIYIYMIIYIYTCMYAHERIIADKASLLWSVTLHATDMQTWTAAPWGLSRSLGTIVQVSRERKYSSTDIKMVCSLRFYCIDLFYLHISTCFICVFDIIGCTDVEFYSILLYCVLFCSVLFFFIGLFWAVQLPKSCAPRR